MKDWTPTGLLISVTDGTSETAFEISYRDERYNVRWRTPPSNCPREDLFRTLSETFCQLYFMETLRPLLDDGGQIPLKLRNDLGSIERYTEVSLVKKSPRAFHVLTERWTGASLYQNWELFSLDHMQEKVPISVTRGKLRLWPVDGWSITR